jgi:hypothetical protein
MTFKFSKLVAATPSERHPEPMHTADAWPEQIEWVGCLVVGKSQHMQDRARYGSQGSDLFGGSVRKGDK